MAKQLNVNLNISANAEQAKAQLQSLQTMLNSLTQSTAGTLPITKEIQEAQAAAAKLKVALNQSINVDTGKFDLSKFNSTLKASGTNLEQIKNKLVALGPTGQQAFLSLAQSIASAEIPAKRTNKWLSEMGTTLKNTVKWQFSSSMLHGFIGAAQTAYRYAQDLNESLNNIRIVTGSSADEMDKFAIKANKAAKSLSASTLEYTNASLIYYQQGLSDEEVAGRTAVTIKMANVSKQSAEEVSDQLTAIWNNFDNGTKSLEYYADVLTALGAATASSTDEISEGLNKFAAVAETVGLSYEYAASALATVTATTRQSADVVGTAFKTLFARIQDLELGETLDDGTTLGSYSMALAKVGISIKDTSGQMKAMDTILEEMAAKWETLGKAEQTALAQSVAGVRQYTQLIALMDNWDFMKENLSTATNAEGTLQAQADIYAESWEAARDRVKAATEAIYSDLLKDDFFIEITNGIEKVLTLFDHFLDSIGGAKGLLSGVASILLTMFSEKAAIGLENMVYNFKSFVGLTKDEAVNTQLQAYNYAQGITSQTAAAGGMAPSSSQEAVTAGMRSQLELSHALAQNREKMSQLQQQEAQAIIQQNQAYSQQVALLATKADSAKKEQQTQREAIYDDISFGEGPAIAEEALDKLDAQIDFGDKVAAEVEQAEQAFQDTGNIDAYRKKMQELASESAKLFGENSDLTKKLRDRGSLEKKGLENKQANEAKNKKQFSKEIDVETRRATVKSATKHIDEKTVNNYIKATKKANKASKDFAKGQEGLAENTKASKKAIESFSDSAKRVSQTVVSVAQSAMSLSFAISSLGRLDDIWSDETLSGGQKLLQTFMALGTGIPMLINGLNGLNSALGISAAFQAGLSMAAEAYAISQLKAGNAITASALAEKTKVGIDTATIIIQRAKTAAALEEMGAEQAKDAAKIKSMLVSKIGIAADKAEIISKKLAAGASVEEAFAEAGLTTAKSAGTVATWIATAANWAFNASLGAILLVVLAVAAAVAVLVGVAVLLANAFKTAQANSPEGKLKALEEESKLLAEQLQEVKDKADELQSAFDDYTSVTEKLASCTKGTEEWYAALNDVNNKVLEIMQQYPELATYVDSEGKSGVTRDEETGALKINENFFKDNQKKLDNAILATTSASQQNEIEKKQIEARIKKDEAGLALWGTGFTRASQDYYNYETGEYGNKDVDRIAAAYSGKSDENIEDVIKSITIDGMKESYGFYGVSDEDFIKEMNNQGYTNINQEWLDAYANEQLQYFNEMVAEYPELSSALTAYSESLNAATVAQKTYNDSLAQSALANNETVKNSKYAEEIMEASGDVYGQLYEQKLNEIKDSWGKDGIAQIDGANAKAQEVWKQYLKAAGLSEKDYKLTDTWGDDNNREFVYKKAGSTEEETIDLDTMQKIYASSLALEALGQSADVLAAKFAELGNSANAGDKALLSFLSQDNFEDATQGEYTKIAEDVEEAGGTESYLAAKIGGADGILDDADAQAYGYKSAAALIEAFNQGLTDIETAWDTISLPTEFDNAGALTLSASKLMSDTFNKMSDEGDAALSNLLDTALKGLDDKDKTIAMDEIAKIDWSDWDAMEQLQEILKTYNIDLKSLDGIDLDNLTNSLRQAGHAVPTEEIEELKKNLTELIQISSDIEIGTIISKEQYDLLIGYNAELAKYFALTADGYKVVGGVDQLTNLNLEQSTEQMRQYQEAYEEMNWASWGHKDENGTWVNADWNAYANGLKSDSAMLGTLNNIMNSDAMMSNLDMFGYDQNYLQSIVDGMNSDDPELQERARQALIDFYAKMNEFNTEAAAGAFDESQINMMNAASAKNLSDLNSMGLEDDSEAYSNGLKSIAANYETCRDELAEYIEAVDEYGLESSQAKKAQEKLTKAMQKTEWHKVAKNVKDYVKQLKETKDIEEIEIIYNDIADVMNETWNTTVDSNWVKDNIDLINEWANATGDRARELAYQVKQSAITATLEAKNILEANGTVKFDINGDGAIDTLTSVGDRWNAMKAIVEANPITMDANGRADMTGLIQALMEAGFSAQEVANYIASIGETDVDISGFGTGIDVPSYDLSTPEGAEQFANFLESISDWDGGIQITGGEVPAAGDVDMSQIGGGSGGGGGGGGSEKEAESTKKSDVVDRYKEIDDKIDDSTRSMDKASKAADRLWGTARINAMRAVNNQLKDNIDLLKKKRKEAQDNLKTDKDALKTALKENVDSGLTDSEFASYFDAEGNFTQYEEILTDLYNEKSKLETEYGDTWDQDEQDAIQAVQDRIDAVKEAIEQYDETKELIQDMDEEIMDAIYEWQDNNYEILNLELELKVEINDANMEMIEYYMSKIEDDVYASAEAFGYMNQQMGIYNSNLQAQDEYARKLEEDYYAGKISMDAYKEGLRNVQSATIENLQSLEEVKQSMREYYGEVLDMALEEIAIYTDEMENLNSVLDHYSNIMELIGKQDDTVTKGKILNSKANNLRNELNVQKKLYEESNAEAEKWAKLMSTAIEGSNEYETYKANWQAAQQAANDAQDAMLSKTEEWAEAMKAIIENELAGFGQELEKALTGGTSFDELLTSMERRSSLQEEYLTHTNKIYETNKLMRTAQQEIDKTTNSIAKKRLQSFIGETNELQNQKELSQYELEIQQAKYDLLLAEIAAEEARNAKSTVRLQRDSEGNMSYVYTADTDAVSAAQQELEDKQNALYNLGLEGANDYSQKYAETLQEAQDAITELTQMWMSGEISSEEEFNRRRAEIQEYYGEKLKQYSGLHQVALTTDSRVIADAWSTDFSDMIGKTNEWNTAVDSYFENAAKSMEAWSEVCATVLEDSGLNDLNGSLSEIDQKSQDLQTTLIGEDGEGGVVAAMMAEAKAAGELSKSYINVQNEIDRLIGKYEELLEKVNADYTNPDTPEVDPAIDPEETPEEETPTETPTEEPEETGPTYQTGTLTWTGNGASRVWKDSSGKTYAYGSAEQKAIQKAFDRAYSANYSSTVGHGYRGDYWLGGGKLDADVLHEKYGLATGGYTGDWEGSYGKLAFLHQKELVLNANDTENFLESMNVLERILQIIDLQALNSALGGGISVPTTGHSKSDILEQQVSIEAHFPNVTNHNEIEEAFNNLINTASQYANRKN